MPRQPTYRPKPRRAPAPADADQRHVSGTVERVTFHSPESGFVVLRVAVRGHREPVTVTGQSAGVSAGEWIDADGRWAVDPQYGPQFKAEVLRTTHPDTLEGIEKYLGSGLIKGIGPVNAARLVKVFGKTVFDIIETQSVRLEEVDGIGPARRRMIKDAWADQKAVRDIMAFLFSHGVTTSRAFRIYKTYGDQAIETLRADPYCLSRDIWGIGFKTADRIAERMGIDKTSPLRARAGIAHVLQELTNDGHCAFPRDQLLEKSVGMLEIPTPILIDALEAEITEGRLISESFEREEPLIYLTTLHRAETQLCRILAGLSRGTHPCPPIDIEKAIQWVEQRTRLKLAETQKAAVRQGVRSKLMIITGGPGVGKTTLVRSLLEIFKAKKLKIVLCAPTGRAAKRLSETTGATAKTIHRLLEFDPAHNAFKHDARHALAGDVFVIDEASMIDLPLAFSLLQAVPQHGAVIFVGDVDQLPSVGPGCVLRDLIDSARLPVCRLTEIFRQAASSLIVTNAHRVNHGQAPLLPQTRTPGSEPPRDFHFVEADDPAQAVALIQRMVRASLPRRLGFDPFRDIQVLTPMQRGELGARALNTALQQALNPDGEAIERFGWQYRSGDKVMQIRNNYDKDVFNGDIGRVRRLDRETRSMTIRFEDRDIVYDFEETDELIPAYACTIHKSQGSEYPCVIIPIHTQHYIMLQRNLLYTAITRGRRMVILIGSKKAVGIAVTRAAASRRVSLLNRRLAAALPPLKDAPPNSGNIAG